MSKHFISAFDQLKNLFYQLCTLVEENFDKAGTALLTCNSVLGQEVIDADTQIDHLEIEIEEECLKILALYRPVAADLRYIITLLKINNDLERIGDLSCNIAKKAVYLSEHILLENQVDLNSMIQKTKEMLNKSLDSLIKMEVQLAYDVCQMDDLVDLIKRQNGKEIIQLIKDNPDQSEQLIKLFAVTRNIERIADLATNISEDVVYCIEGDIIRHKHTVNDTLGCLNLEN